MHGSHASFYNKFTALFYFLGTVNDRAEKDVKIVVALE